MLKGLELRLNIPVVFWPQCAIEGLIIPKIYQQNSEKNCLTKKLVTQIFFTQNWFVNLSKYKRIFQIFF